MQALEYLKGYKKRSNDYLDSFFNRKLTEIDDLEQALGSFAIQKELVRSYQQYISGGKRVRGALVELGHNAGTRNGDILPPSVGVEIIHSFLLIHDDFMDRDDMRRNKPTVHRIYENWGREHLDHPDPKHYGNSMAITLGDLGYCWGNELIINSEFSTDRKISAMRYLGDVLEKTIYGQSLDLSQQLVTREEDAMRVCLLKTANYTFTGPLRFGGILGEADNTQLSAMKVFGDSIGVAFQLRDDELGLFGNEDQLGKPIGSDVREGRNTLLFLKTIERATDLERCQLKSIHGKSDIEIAELDIIREIATRTEALAYCQTLTRDLVNKGCSAIKDVTHDMEHREILESLAEYIRTRNK